MRRLISILVCVVSVSPVRAEWLRLVSPSCTVISEVSEARTRAWAVEFERFRRAIGQLLMVAPGGLEPVSVVLFQSDRRFRPFKPFEQGRPARVGGYFLRAPGRNIIALSVDGARDEVRERVFHEATHWYLSALDRPPPLWLNEGLAEFFGTLKPGAERFSVGSSLLGWVEYLRISPPTPFADLNRVAEGSLRFNGQHAEQTERFYAQSWATVHLLMLGGDAGSLIRLRDYLRRPDADESAGEVAAAFGETPSNIDTRLGAYLWKKRWLQYTVPFAQKVDGSGFTARPASAGEVDLALGELLIGVGRPTDASPYIDRAYASLPADARPAAALGEIELAAGRPERALARFEESFARGGSSFLGHYLAAAAILKEFSPDGSHSAEQLQKLTAHLVSALTINPRVRECYDLIGLLAAYVPDAETSHFSALLREGRKRFPTDPVPAIGLSFIALQQGRLDEARRQRSVAIVEAVPPDSPVLELRARLDERLKDAAAKLAN